MSMRVKGILGDKCNCGEMHFHREVIIQPLPVQSVKVGDYVLCRVKVDKIEGEMVRIGEMNGLGCPLTWVSIKDFVSLEPEPDEKDEAVEKSNTCEIKTFGDGLKQGYDEGIKFGKELGRGERLTLIESLLKGRDAEIELLKVELQTSKSSGRG